MQAAESGCNDGERGTGDGGSVAIQLDPKVKQRAERVARSRGTTLSELVREYVSALAETEWKHLPSLEWLDTPRDEIWIYLEHKHR